MTINSTLSGLRILITNDDGINALGLKALEKIANSISPDVWTVAPENGQSGKGFSVTFDNILRVKEMSPRRFSVSGTPADCVYIALGEILKDHKPDLILSGINSGSNIANFIGMSGTVGATFAGASRNIKSIAVSQDFKNIPPTKFAAVESYLPKIIKRLVNFTWADGVCMNINFPEAKSGEIAGIRIAKQGQMDVTWNVFKRNDPSDVPYYWLRSSQTDKCNIVDSDIQLLEQKMITITPVQCRHEHSDSIEKLEELFASNV